MVLILVSRYVHEKHACMISLNEVALLNASDVWTFSDALPLTMMSADAKNAAFFLHAAHFFTQLTQLGVVAFAYGIATSPSCVSCCQRSTTRNVDNAFGRKMSTAIRPC